MQWIYLLLRPGPVGITFEIDCKRARRICFALDKVSNHAVPLCICLARASEVTRHDEM